LKMPTPPQNRKNFQKFLRKVTKLSQNNKFGLFGSFLIILSHFRPFDPILEQNKFRKAEKIKIFMRNF